MMAAYAAAESGHAVTLLEQNEKLGKKLFITGKGRCNLTNASDMEQLFANVVSNRKFLYSAFYSYDNEQVISFFESHGMPTKTERGNRVFPVSDHSSDVIAALSTALRGQHVEVFLHTKVKRLLLEKRDEEKRVTGVELADHTKMHADAVIVATGGISYPSTGATGDGYRMAEESGHFTHFGVSGPLVLSASGCIPAKAFGQELSMTIDLKPALDVEQLDHRILREFDEMKNKQFKNSLGHLLPAKMIPVMIALSGIDPDTKVNEISREQRQNLLHLFKNMPLTITGLRDFKEAIITKGGVSVKDINPSTMESKLVQGLYFCGEVLDLDALTGGYNLQIAWSTGHLAGISVL